MSRAEFRRQQRENERKTKTYVMTVEELDKIRQQEFERARKQLLSKSDDLAVEIFRMMLVIPTNVLINDYWVKSAKKRIPRFVEDCLSLYRSWLKGSVSMTDMQELTEEYAQIKLIQDGTATDKTHKERQEKGID
ncbi:MAG: hypothetical protein IKU28_01355 [Erysipelotrichaceae bacterium]|nr:hypothetical protein [Erysipelotrichaceae bacterium]